MAAGHERAVLGDFKPIKLLGRGGYGKVFLVKKRGGADSGRFYAMKTTKKSDVNSEKRIAHIKTERRVLEQIRGSPFLVSLHYALHTKKSLYLVMDFFECKDLARLLRQLGSLTERQTKFYVTEIVLALQKLHEMGIAHRDLKPHNILMDAVGHVAVADYGLCKQFPTNQKDKKSSSCCGTLKYMAPEVIHGSGHNTSADWWSLGVLTYEMLSGTTPFEVRNGKILDVQATYKQILRNRPHLPRQFSTPVARFIRHLLIKTPELRLGGGPKDAEELKRHSFLSNVDWDAVKRKAVLPPILPSLDLSCYDYNLRQAFKVESPHTSQDPFKSYSFVSPSLAEIHQERPCANATPTAQEPGEVPTPPRRGVTVANQQPGAAAVSQEPSALQAAVRQPMAPAATTSHSQSATEAGGEVYPSPVKRKCNPSSEGRERPPKKISRQ